MGGSRRRVVLSFAMLFAGALAAISRIPHWATLTFPTGASARATVAVGHAPAAVYLGIVLLVRGVIGLAWREDRATSWTGFGLVSGALLGGFAVYDLLTQRGDAIEQLARVSAAGTGRSTAAWHAVIERQLAVGIVTFSFTWGIYLALLAAAIATVAGALSLRLRWGRMGQATRGPGSIPGMHERLARPAPAPLGPGPAGPGGVSGVPPPPPPA